MSEWQPIESAPKDGKPVLVHYINVAGKSRVVKAQYIAKYTVEATDFDDLDHDYCEEKGEHFAPEGWYEVIDNWGDFSYITFDRQHEPNAWMPLPPPPPAEGGEK